MLNKMLKCSQRVEIPFGGADMARIRTLKITDGPDRFDLSAALFRREPVCLRVLDRDTELYERWEVVITQVKVPDLGPDLIVSGRVTRSGPTKESMVMLDKPQPFEASYIGWDKSGEATVTFDEM